MSATRRDRRPTVRLFGRAGCHLCDQARAAIEGLRAEGLEFELDEVDINGDERLLASMLERIPVVELDGEPVFELLPDADALRARIATVSA